MIPIQFYIFATFCLLAEGESLVGQKRFLRKCEGSLRLVSPCGQSHKYLEKTPHIRFKAAMAVLEGCGCYRLHERKNYRGKSFTLTKHGRHAVTLKKVRSISKISCSSDDGTKEDTSFRPDISIMKIRKHCKKKRHKLHY